MKKLYGVLALIGAVICSATIFLRETALMDYDIIKQILWVAPNFGAVWIGVGFTIMLYPSVFKKEFIEINIYYLLGLIFIILLLSEIIHDLLLNSPFDVWDMLASITASIFIMLFNIIKKQSGLDRT